MIREEAEDLVKRLDKFYYYIKMHDWDWDGTYVINCYHGDFIVHDIQLLKEIINRNDIMEMFNCSAGISTNTSFRFSKDD